MYKWGIFYKTTLLDSSIKLKTRKILNSLLDKYFQSNSTDDKMLFDIVSLYSKLLLNLIVTCDNINDCNF